MGGNGLSPESRPFPLLFLVAEGRGLMNLPIPRLFFSGADVLAGVGAAAPQDHWLSLP